MIKLKMCVCMCVCVCARIETLYKKQSLAQMQMQKYVLTPPGKAGTVSSI